MSITVFIQQPWMVVTVRQALIHLLILDTALKPVREIHLRTVHLAPIQPFRLLPPLPAVLQYTIANDSAPTLIPTVTIGTQTCMQYNLDVGTRINGSVDQTNNGIVEKWCFDNLPANCTTYGGMYIWQEMMQYSVNEGAQGIAPAGFHIPTVAEWTTLSTYLGGAAVAGDKMKSTGLCQGRSPCGSSGLNGLLGGFYNGGSNNLGSYVGFWSSSYYDASHAVTRDLYTTDIQVSSDYDDISIYYGNYVRAIKN